MRKQYKPTYGFTLFCSIEYFMILMYIAFTPIFVVFGTNGASWFEIIGTFILFTCIFLILFLVINLISKCFTKYNVIVGDTTIYYANDCIDYDDIRSISYDFGEIGRYNSTFPQSVIIMGKKHGYIHIERPSIIFLFKLVSKCGNKFKINRIKRLIFLWPGLALIGGTIFYFIITYSK